jgi:uncharacterized repeat protein (TIGR01451 family)
MNTNIVFKVTFMAVILMSAVFVLNVPVVFATTAGETCVWKSLEPNLHSDQFCVDHHNIFGSGNSDDCECVTVACNTNSDCGTNGATGNAFCQNNGIYKDYITYTCQNPGTANAKCSNLTAPQLINNCPSNQTCNSTTATCQNNCTSHSTKQCDGNNSVYWYDSCGTKQEVFQQCTSNQICSGDHCVDQHFICSSDSDCSSKNGYIGSPFCQGTNSIFQTYRTYTCQNPGTVNSTCVPTDASQKKNDCGANQTCANGFCSNQNIVCATNSDCGTNSYTGSVFCQSNGVYQNYITYTCNNPGTAASTCSNSTVAQLRNTCSGNQICSNGNCANNCTNNSYQQCSGSYLYWYDSCGNIQGQGQYCPNGCNGNTCQNYINTCTQNSYQKCSGSYLYWYDSCGNIQGQGQYCANGCYNNSCNNNYNYGNNLTVNKTVRNLSNGSGFASSTYASPSDMVMFMITVQANGAQTAQNVFVRDLFPANLIYKNQLVVACSSTGSTYGNYNNCNNSNYNYSGDVTSGINLGAVYAGQTVTITYQAQLASAYNFSYGTTTLNNNVSVTSSNGSNPTSNASIIVTRTAVYGASAVSTGLTNNFWADSFFLPLLITLILIWMWRSGMFFGIEKWILDQKNKNRNHKTERELALRISNIKKAEKA